MASSATYIVGLRQAGKSRAITRLIGDGASTLVIVETEHDRKHHALHSPRATVCSLDDIHNMCDYRVVVLDNVVFGSTDRLLQEALVVAENGARLIVAVSHPASIPVSGHGVILQLCDYHDELAVRCLNTLKATDAFQLLQATVDGPVREPCFI